MAVPQILTGLAAAAPVLVMLADFADNTSPKLEDEATVEIIGEPGSTKRQLYFLALNTAFGLCRPGARARDVGGIPTGYTPSPALVLLEYDAADNWVRCTVRYKVGMLTPSGTSIPITGFSGIRDLINESRVLNGPDHFVEGGSPILPIPVFALPIDGASKFINRTILTSAGAVIDPDPAGPAGGAAKVISSPNPKPPGDNRSRGAAQRRYGDGSNAVIQDWLIPMVFTALSDPGSRDLVLFEGPISGALGK